LIPEKDPFNIFPIYNKGYLMGAIKCVHR